MKNAYIREDRKLYVNNNSKLKTEFRKLRLHF